MKIGRDCGMDASVNCSKSSLCFVRSRETCVGWMPTSSISVEATL